MWGKQYRRTKPSPRGEGKEEAALPQKRKPTPPRCARQPLPREVARVDAPSFLWKEGECRLTDFPRRRLTIRECRFPALSFRAKARNLFRLRSGKGYEDSGEREAPCFQRIGRTVFHADSITKENGKGKRKRSLGCARDDETRERLFPFLFNLLRKPTPPHCARQPLPREGARVDTPSFLWKEGVCRLTDFPRRRLTIRECRFPALSFRAKARNLFRSRSGKGCEDSGELEAPCFQRIRRTVFHADSITKENGRGKRKRSLGCARDDETRECLFPFLFNLLRKPTPPRCARQPLPREGARVDTPSFLWGRLRYEDTAISFLPHFLDLSILFSCRLRS